MSAPQTRNASSRVIRLAFPGELFQSGTERHFINDFYRWLEYDKSPERRRHARSIDGLPGLSEAVDMNEADVWILPMTWNYYLEHNKVGLVHEAVKGAQRKGKKVVAFSTGDFTANVPFKGLTIFEASVYKSRNSGAQALPVFIDDYVEKYTGGQLLLRKKQPKPVVGFCGQAGGGAVFRLGRAGRLAVQRASWKAGLRMWEPATIEHTGLRSRILRQLSRSPLVETNFVLRKMYKGGEAGSGEKVKEEFVRNIVESDYVVCVRGTGNFSTRFYETLCLGRIPIFIDTDCRLPFDSVIDWEKYCVWIDETEIDLIDAKVLDFHDRLSAIGFQELQTECRKLWSNRLSRDHFYHQVHESLSAI